MADRPHSADEKRGFTLVEMMVTCAIALVLMAGVFTAFAYQRRAFKTQESVNDMQQNVRTALDSVTRDVRVAGYGLKVPSSKLHRWVDWIPGFTANPFVKQGTGLQPDQLVIAAAFDEPLGTLAVATTNGASSITLASGDGANFNTTDRKIIFIGRTETARIVGQAGDTLRVSRHPTEDKNLNYAYPVGTPVELVRVVTYERRNATTVYPFQPHLIRENSDELYAAEWQKMTAGNIDDFQITENALSVTVDVTGRTAHEDDKYTDPNEDDHFRRLVLAQRVYPRNAGLKK